MVGRPGLAGGVGTAASGCAFAEVGFGGSRAGESTTMTLSQQEYRAIVDDASKVINENIVWEGAPYSPRREFRIDIESDEGYPIFIKGWYNSSSGKLSYSMPL